MLDLIYITMLILVIILLNYQAWKKAIEAIKKVSTEYKNRVKAVNKKSGYKVAWVIWKFNNPFIVISQLIGIIALIFTLSKYNNQWNGYYVIPLIFVVILPLIILITAKILKKVVIDK